jgi:hypothetical protein
MVPLPKTSLFKPHSSITDDTPAGSILYCSGNALDRMKPEAYGQMLITVPQQLNIDRKTVLQLYLSHSKAF